jgi:hypothetical protein
MATADLTSADVTVPLAWTIGIGLGSASLSFAGAWVGVAKGRKTARELDVWRRREETMRLLRWGVELAVDSNDLRANVGLATLAALEASPDLLQVEDLDLVAAVADAILQLPVTEYSEGGDGGTTDLRSAERAYEDATAGEGIR